MTISICMGIYNGEKYIEKQLLSILRQSVTVDEVILCDDCSEDDTVAIVERFIQRNQLEGHWKLYRNNENKGYPGNFYYAMSLCTQDLVFLADQDDIWQENKLEVICNIFAARTEAKAVCCKFGLIDEKDHRIRSVMQPVISWRTGRTKNITIERVFYKCEWPGMVLAYRRGWYEQRLTEWSDKRQFVGNFQIPHDLLVCIWAAEAKGFLQVDKELAYHRRHDNNAGGEEHRVSKVLDKERKLWEIEKYCSILEELRIKEVMSTHAGRVVLMEKEASMRGRYNALHKGKIGGIIGNGWKYRSMMRIATIVGDILIAEKMYRNGMIEDD